MEEHNHEDLAVLVREMKASDAAWLLKIAARKTLIVRDDDLGDYPARQLVGGYYCAVCEEFWPYTDTNPYCTLMMNVHVWESAVMFK